MNADAKTAAGCKAGQAKQAVDAAKLAADKARVIAECKAIMADRLARFMAA